MPIKSNKLGPGTLTIGAVGTPLDWTAQVASCTVKWSKNQEDGVPVLSGETLSGDKNWTAKLAANLILDLSDDGLVEYTWANKGEEVGFTFVPDTAAGKAISGVVSIDPIDVGGDSGKTMRSDIEWDCVGAPELTTDLT
jgi:hypothetical protein